MSKMIRVSKKMLAEMGFVTTKTGMVIDRRKLAEMKGGFAKKVEKEPKEKAPKKVEVVEKGKDTKTKSRDEAIGIY